MSSWLGSLPRLRAATPFVNLAAITQGQHRDVIGLWPPSRKILRRGPQAGYNALHRILAVLAQKALQPFLLKKIPIRTSGLGHAVSVEHYALSRLDPASSSHILHALEHTQHGSALRPQQPS